MKKLILSSAAILLFAFTTTANDGKCSKKNEKNCSPKECSKGAKVENKNACSFSPEKKCSKESSKCESGVAKTSTKKVDL